MPQGFTYALHAKRLGCVEVLWLIRTRVKFRQHARPDTLHLCGVMRAVARPFVQGPRVCASVRVHMSSPGFVVMQANHAVANRTFRIQRVKPPFSQQLYQLYEPYGQMHGRFASFARDREPVVRAQLCAGIVALDAEMHRRN